MVKYTDFEIYENKNGIEGGLYCRDKNKRDWYEIVKETKVNINEVGLLIYEDKIVDINNDLSVFFPSNKFDVVICKKENWMKRGIKIFLLKDKIKVLEVANE